MSHHTSPPPPPAAPPPPDPPRLALTATPPLNGDGSLNGARILLVDSRGELRPHLAADGVYVAHLTDPADLLRTVARAPWDVLVTGPDQSSAEALERLARVRADQPDVGLVMTLDDRQPADLATFVKARPDELVRLPVSEGTLGSALTSAMAAVRRRRGIPPKPSARPAAQTSARPRAAVVAVTGPGGGAGRTTTALALAHLAAQQGGHVVLADLDTHFGTAAAALRVVPTRSAYEVLFDDLGRRYDRRLVAEHLRDALVTVRDGFSVLAAPGDPVDGDALGTDEVEALVAVLRRTCDVLVLDCPAGLSERTLTALDVADHHVVVSEVDAPAIAKLRAYLQTLARLDAVGRSQAVVLNKELPGSGVTGADVQAAIGPVAAILPFDAEVLRARNEGRPVSAAHPDHEITRRYRAVLDALVGGAPAAGGLPRIPAAAGRP